VNEAIEKNKREFSQQAQRIRSDPDLNDDAKGRKISEAYEEASRRHEELLRQDNEAQQGEIRDLERSVFAISYPFEASTWRDKEMVRQSYRDAAFRVFGMDPHDLERMLDRAERTGDTQLACAVYHEALERGITSLTEPYMEHYPDAKERYRRYAAAQRRTRRGVGARIFSKTEIPEPPEAFEHKRKSRSIAG
jgi:hypothetical protein